jgi:hypothetical protein
MLLTMLLTQCCSIGLHNVGGRMGEFRVLYLLCMPAFSSTATFFTVLLQDLTVRCDAA